MAGVSAKPFPILVPSRCAAAFDERSLDAVLAMIEPTRCRILAVLGQRGRVCVGDIAKCFNISRPAISHHLKILKTSGLVETEREGQEIYYSARIDRITGLLRALADSLEACCPRSSK